MKNKKVKAKFILEKEEELLDSFFKNMKSSILSSKPTVMKTQKTQINHLRTGMKNQMINPNVDYSSLPRATTHQGHAGSRSEEVKETWDKVVSENPDVLCVEFNEAKYKLKSSKSISGKSTMYFCPVDDLDLAMMGIVSTSVAGKGFFSIQGNRIMFSNGKNSYVWVCPSLIKIL